MPNGSVTTSNVESAPPLDASPAPNPRVALWDNARFMVMALVVIGHGIQRLIAHNDDAMVVYLTVYAFHIPAFILVSGYFSKATAPTLASIRKLLTTIVVPYIIFETIWSAIIYLVEGPRSYNPAVPSWTLWFLLALAALRILLPYLAQLRWPLFWSILISVGVGFIDNIDSTLSLNRTLGLLPFFVLGWRLKQWNVFENWRLLRSPPLWLRTAAAACFVGFAGFAALTMGAVRHQDVRYWFFYEGSYDSLHWSSWTAVGLRLAVLGVGTVLVLAFLILVPRRRSWITDLGQATLYIYLLHAFVLYPIRESGMLNDKTSPLWLIGMIIFCVGVTMLLGTKPFKKAFRPLIEPRTSWLYTPGPT